jgi:sarcosine oxidase, subunit beta
MTSVPPAAEVVVVGAGVVGSSTAYNLTRLGVRDVVVVDKDGVAAHASRLSAGIVRTHYSNPHEARLAQRGLEWFENWEELVGGDPGFVRTGMANLVSAPDHEKLRRNVKALQEAGVETHLVGPEELVELEPEMQVDEHELAAYEPRSGYANPGATTRALAAAARRDGASFIEGVAVTAVDVTDGRVAGVQTSAGRISARSVVLACGSWSVPLAASIGITIPIEPIAVRVAFAERSAGMRRGGAGHLVVLDRACGTYLRPEGERLTLLGLQSYHLLASEPDDYERPPDRDFEELARLQVSERFPGFASSAVVRSHTGPIDLTPDLCAILGGTPYEGLFLAVGMSGSGFKKAPATGECVAALVAGQKSPVPIEAFRLSRFQENDPIVSHIYEPDAKYEERLGASNLIH